MRLLRLILKILLTAALLVQPVGAWASSAKMHSSKKSLRKQNLREVGNVWDRLRAGMQIPRDFPAQMLAMQSLPANNPANTPKNIIVKTTVLSTQNHDDEHRIRLHSMIGADPVTKARIKSRLAAGELQKQIVNYVDKNASESVITQNRIRTRIEFHRPENTTDSNIPTEALAKPEVVIKTVATTATKEGAAHLVKLSSEKEPQNTKSSGTNDRISRYIAWYAQRPTYLQQVAERAKPYLYHIVSELGANHLPAELALLPIVESAYQPTAQSPKSAAGLWQFIPSTGLDFDLTQSDRYDARLDITASTQAAIRYLSYLKRHFNGDWLLALAAYNCGVGRVDDAIASNRANGLPTDYWSLRLPEETQEYVPRFLALANIFASPTNYGLKLPTIKNEPYFVQVKVERKFAIDYLANQHLVKIAELANLSYEQFVQLNPGYLKSKPETDEPFTLLLPVSSAKQLHQHLNHVERFLVEPSVLLSKSPLHKKLQPDDKTLPVAIVGLLSYKLPKLATPLLSLNLNANQTTPRIRAEPILSDFPILTLSSSGMIAIL
jgi:hypothetical protein